MKYKNLRINLPRLKSRLEKLATIGSLKNGGVCRLALTDEDREARNLFIEWLEQCKAEVKVDRMGNIFGIRQGQKDISPVMVGSHLDTVTTGGLYDGSLGVLAALEILEVLNENDIKTERPFVVVNFTNEEGVRFAPGMTGSKAFVGKTDTENLLKILSTDETSTLGSELKRIGFDGNIECGSIGVHCFLELHIEQGPILERNQKEIGIVESVQGIYWTEYIIEGESGHAGTTPMDLRKDAGYVASRISCYLRELTSELGGVGTIGFHELVPNATNVIPEKARIRIDFRHPDKELLNECQHRLDRFVEEACCQEGVTYESKQLIREKPVEFDQEVVKLIEQVSDQLRYSSRRMDSGAGHDAQMMARACPASMIFIPCRDGISHNVNEYAEDQHIEAGANVLLNTAVELLNS